MAAFLHAPRQATQVGPGRQCGLIGKLTLTRPAKIMGRLLIRTCLAACLRVEQSFRLGMQFTSLLAGISSLSTPLLSLSEARCQCRCVLRSAQASALSIRCLPCRMSRLALTGPETLPQMLHHIIIVMNGFAPCKKGRPAGHVFRKQRLPGTRVGNLFAIVRSSLNYTKAPIKTSGTTTGSGVVTPGWTLQRRITSCRHGVEGHAS